MSKAISSISGVSTVISDGSLDTHTIHAPEMVQRGKVTGKSAQSDIISRGIRRKLQFFRLPSFSISQDQCSNHVIKNKARECPSRVFSFLLETFPSVVQFSPCAAVKPSPQSIRFQREQVY